MAHHEPNPLSRGHSTRRATGFEQWRQTGRTETPRCLLPSGRPPSPPPGSMACI